MTSAAKSLLMEQGTHQMKAKFLSPSSSFLRIPSNFKIKQFQNTTTMQPGKLLHPYTNNIAPKTYKRNKDNLKLSSSEIKAISTLSQDWIFACILQLQQMGINQNTLFTLLDTN
jgi:hypothetical protein